MGNEPRILVIAPYERYASIDRCVACLERELASRAAVRVRVIRPKRILGRLSAGRARKWAGYLDQLFIVPRLLAREARRSDLVHLTDQSLSIYTRVLAGKAHVVNCHDLIAVRAALGELPESRTGFSGRLLRASPCLLRVSLSGQDARTQEISSKV